MNRRQFIAALGLSAITSDCNDDMRKRRFLMPLATPPITPSRRYNVGHYVVIRGTQHGNATGQDSGAFSYTGGGGILISGNYSSGGIPGGHTGTANYPGLGALVRNTDGPCSSGVKGVSAYYNWGDIEIAQNVYDWTVLDADLAMCIALGVQFIPIITVRTFSAGNNPAPGALGTYLNQLPYVIAYTAGAGPGWQMSRWNATVQTRFRALVNAMGARYDSVSNFEGIATQETAVGMSNAEQTATGYTQPGFLTGLQLESDYIMAACPSGRHFGYQNFMPADQIGNSVADGRVRLGQYSQYLASKKAVMGGPDILPDLGTLQPEVYQRYEDVANTAPPNNGPLFCSMQNDSFTQATRTMTELFQWSTGTPLSSPALPANYIQFLHLDYMFWFWHIAGGGGPNFWDPQARTVIATNPSGWHFYNP